MNTNVNKETLELINQSLSKGGPVPNDLFPNLRKDDTITTGTGLVFYDLQPGALRLYPVLTPLRNKIPRIGANGGTTAHWKAITGINTAGLSAFVSEGNRNARMKISTANYSADYKMLGQEVDTSFEAQLAAQGFDDARAIAMESALRGLMISEEQEILGGNSSVALTQTNRPTCTPGTAGNLTAGTYSVVCVALTNDGFAASSISGGIPGEVVRNNVDGSQDTFGGGNAKASQNRTATIGAGVTNGSIACSIDPMVGAVGYAWFWSTTAGHEILGAITTVASVVITDVAGGVQDVSGAGIADADYSTNDLAYDGLLTQFCKNGSGAYVKYLDNGSKLTSDGAGGISEFNDAFEAFWLKYKLMPDEVWVNAQEQKTITKLVVANGGAPLLRLNMDANHQDGSITAGTIVKGVIEPINGTVVRVIVHPNLPPGTCFFYSNSIPYPLSGVANVVQMKMRRDYYSIAWPLRTRKYEDSVYADGVLQNYAPFAFGVISNITPA